MGGYGGNPRTGQTETGAKKHRGEWAPNPGTDRTGSEFPAKCAGNPCQSCQSRGRSWVAMKSPGQFFMSFRGPKAHPNRRHKPIVCPTCAARLEAVDEFGEAVGDLVANPAELGEPVRLVAGGGSGIFKAPVNSAGPDRKDGATLFGVVAHGDHIVEGLAGEVIDVLGPVGADIDADLRQCRDGFRPDTAGAGPGAAHLQAIAGHMAQQALGHLAAPYGRRSPG